jgi:hypothetical protein
MQRDLQEIEHHLGKTKETSWDDTSQTGKPRGGRTVRDSQSSSSISISPLYRPLTMGHPYSSDDTVLILRFA